MLRGLYAAGSAMKTNSDRIEVVSNNLSNINTLTYKRDEVLTESFEEVLLMKRNGLHYDARYSSDGFTYQENDGKFLLNLPKGLLKLDGKTTFNYSHSAEVSVDSEGYLSTFYRDGNSNIYPEKFNRLYGQNGYIKVDDKEVTFDEKGNVLLDGEIVDNIVFRPSGNVIGTMGYGVKVERTETMFEQGPLEKTFGDMDLALEGKGFFQVETDFGRLYTRDGRFKINKERQLVTSEGFLVQGLNGPINIDGENFQVNEFGEIIVDNVTVDKLNMINIKNTYDLRKNGAGYYNMPTNIEIIEEPFDAEVKQGYIENSNVNSIKEMVNLLELYRTYEANQKVVSSYDSTLDKAVNQIGRV